MTVDRVSAFNNPEVIRMLQHDFIPVALDGGLMFRRKGPEGAFYRKFADTQARYAAAADGTSLARKTWVPSPHLNRWMKEAMARFAALPETSRRPAVDPSEVAKSTQPIPPPGGLVLTVTSRYLKGSEVASASSPQAARQPGYDRVWLTRAEWQALLPKGDVKTYAVDQRLVRKLARFHALDIVGRTRPPWPEGSVKECRLNGAVLPGATQAVDVRLTGFMTVEGPSRPGPTLGPDDGEIRLRLKVEGLLRYDPTAQAITRLDLVAYGPYSKAGRLAELGFHFRLAGNERKDGVPPWAVDRHHLYGDYPTYYLD